MKKTEQASNFKPNADLHSLSRPQLLHYFEKLFSEIAIRHGHYNAFEHFLDCCINAFCFNYDNEIMDYIRKKYNQDERYKFGEMFLIWIVYMNKHVTSDNIFYDFFGTFYEQQAMNKKNGFAQYFTPETICKLMVSIVSPAEEAKCVLEPTCGSGRLNLAMHAENHRLLHLANDLDYTCAKMTALNFLLHGVKGVVTCDDTLLPKTAFKGAFLINYNQAPYIEFTDDVEIAYSFINTVFPSNYKEQSFVIKNNDDIPEIKNVTSLSELGKQLKLF